MPNFTIVTYKMWAYSRRSAPRAKFHLYLGRNVGIQPPKLKISNFAHKFAPQGRIICTIFM